MLAINAFLRGLWVSILVTAVWAIVASVTGWDWMRPLGIWVLWAVWTIAAVGKVISDSPRERRCRSSAPAPGGAKCWR